MDRVQKRGEVISQEQRNKVSQRYHRITRAINSEFWDIDSDTEHSFYVGSYGRGTAIDTSDIDILVELPREVYEKYDAQKGNGQSRLLQATREAILQTYPESDVHADGQVVVIDFTDGIKFEILPAFKQLDWLGNWNGKYDYADTNMGGNWRSTNPKAEQEAMKERNRLSKGLLFDTCKHIREIRDSYFNSYHLSGIVIDSYVFHHIDEFDYFFLPFCSFICQFLFKFSILLKSLFIVKRFHRVIVFSFNSFIASSRFSSGSNLTISLSFFLLISSSFWNFSNSLFILSPI